MTIVDIEAINGHPNADYLELSVASCNREIHVKVEETPDEVRLTATINGSHSPLECMDGTDVQLSDKLGMRRVIEDPTGEVFQVNRTGFREFDEASDS
ncbi:hypothetical protein GCM10027591_08010 [Zhihengliuella somnathii]